MTAGMKPAGQRWTHCYISKRMPCRAVTGGFKQSLGIQYVRASLWCMENGEQPMQLHGPQEGPASQQQSPALHQCSWGTQHLVAAGHLLSNAMQGMYFCNWSMPFDSSPLAWTLAVERACHPSSPSWLPSCNDLYPWTEAVLSLLPQLIHDHLPRRLLELPFVNLASTCIRISALIAPRSKLE